MTYCTLCGLLTNIHLDCVGVIDNYEYFFIRFLVCQILFLQYYLNNIDFF